MRASYDPSATRRGRALLATVAPFLAIAIVGCGVSESDLVGTWKGQLRVEGAKEGGNQDERNKKAVESLVNLAQPTLELKADHTFAFLGLSGEWKFEASQLTLTPKAMLGFDVTGGKDAAEPIVLDVAGNGKTLSVKDPTSTSKGQYVFTKEGAD